MDISALDVAPRFRPNRPDWDQNCPGPVHLSIADQGSSSSDRGAEHFSLLFVCWRSLAGECQRAHHGSRMGVRGKGR